MEKITPENVINPNAIDASVWRLGALGRMLSNYPEDNAAHMAEENEDVIFFFAELSVTSEVEDDTDHLNHRDAGTGRYVTQNYAEEHPDTTISESD